MQYHHSLNQQRLLSLRSAAVSLGGAADRGLGLPPGALDCIRTAIARNGTPELSSRCRAEAVEQRMQRYEELASGHEIKAYINVGGGVASTGGESAKHLYRAGLNRRLKYSPAEVDCVMTRFAGLGRPVIHLVEIRQLAEQYGFPIAPTSCPPPGEGKPFHLVGPQRGLATTVLVGILVMLRGCVSAGLGYRMLNWLSRGLSRRNPHQLTVISPPVPEPQLMV